METTTNSLQAIIEQRATEKLLKDMIALSDFIRSNRLLGHNDIPVIFWQKEHQAQKNGAIDGEHAKVYDATNFVAERINSAFWATKVHARTQLNGKFADIIYQLWLPVYIKEETESFVQKVDSLQGQLDDLKSGSNEDFD